MKHPSPTIFVTLVTLCLTALLSRAQAGISLSDADARKIGQQIWKNESGGTVDGLTAWNSGEDFASLGIGHFIWYPKGQRGPFEESFPAFIAFARQVGLNPPAITRLDACPWPNRSAFQRDFRSAEMKVLRQFLAETTDTQVAFIVQRLEEALPKMLSAAPGAERDAIRRNFYNVAASPTGLYALIDYVNFKGEGTSPTERYRGEGWGLLQVLGAMRNSGPGPVAARDFARAAQEVLTRRVRNSPKERNEAQWLAGWKNRCETYIP